MSGQDSWTIREALFFITAFWATIFISILLSIGTYAAAYHWYSRHLQVKEAQILALEKKAEDRAVELMEHWIRTEYTTLVDARRKLTKSNARYRDTMRKQQDRIYQLQYVVEKAEKAGFVLRPEPVTKEGTNE